jgi:hypothetical protein
MFDLMQDCPVCGCEQQFAQHHPYPERCPDYPGEQCPELFCVACGSGVLTGLPPAGATIAVIGAATRPAALRLGQVA